ncbi:MAG: hypothetical protein LBT32_00220 [Peptococcaceae bacterium]|nr:hypothetical protein [Peptococcaceae bacterium]
MKRIHLVELDLDERTIEESLDEYLYTCKVKNLAEISIKNQQYEGKKFNSICPPHC